MNRELTVISLNIQHARNAGNTALSLTLERPRMIANLDRIARFLKKYEPDVILLQEVEHVSAFPGPLDQLAYLAKRIGHRYVAKGTASEVRLGTFVMYAAGCGIISRYPITDFEHVKFQPCLPAPRKGFLMARIAISPGMQLTAVSAHLAPFNRLNARSKKGQVERMTRALKGRGPIIFGGDLNSSLTDMGRGNLTSLATGLNLTTHRHALERRLATYPSHKPRRKIDWIMTSPDLRMTDYRVLEERVSDHLAIHTTVALPARL